MSELRIARRSSIVSETQRDEALRTIDDVSASGLWPGRVVTKVSPAGEFWEAEPDTRTISSVTRRLYLPLPALWLETASARRCGHLRPHFKTSSPATR